MHSYFGTFYFGEFKPHNSYTWVTPINVGTVSIFTPFNFAVLLSSRNSRNKGHANIKGFTVCYVVRWQRRSWFRFYTLTATVAYQTAWRRSRQTPTRRADWLSRWNRRWISCERAKVALGCFSARLKAARLWTPVCMDTGEHIALELSFLCDSDAASNLYIIIGLWRCHATRVAYVDGRQARAAGGERRPAAGRNRGLGRRRASQNRDVTPAAWLTRADGQAGTSTNRRTYVCMYARTDGHLRPAL